MRWEDIRENHENRCFYISNNANPCFQIHWFLYFKINRFQFFSIHHYSHPEVTTSMYKKKNAPPFYGRLQWQVIGSSDHLKQPRLDQCSNVALDNTVHVSFEGEKVANSGSSTIPSYVTNFFLLTLLRVPLLKCNTTSCAKPKRRETCPSCKIKCVLYLRS